MAAGDWLYRDDAKRRPLKLMSQIDLESAPPLEGAPPRRRLPLVLCVVAAVALVVIAVTAGWLVRGGSTAPTAGSVDAGFARDMAAHHTQAVTMAGYVRDTTTNPSVKLLATDIELTQQGQLGEFLGWLDVWGLPRQSAMPPMSWMGGHVHLASGALMPGMATPGQMIELESSAGARMDILFLQLMIHHHQGGLPMAQYAAQHATEPYVRKVAAAMVTTQSGEIIQMEQLLRKLGGAELPPPAS